MSLVKTYSGAVEGRTALLWFALLVTVCFAGVDYLRDGMLAGEGKPGVDDLPLVEVRAGADAPHDVMAVMLTGDGGWGWLDRRIGRELARAGIPAVGWNSLRYYWRGRTPDEAAADLRRILDTYGAAWHKRRFLLVGYSFGADALPFLVNRLPPEVRSRIVGVSLVAIGRDAAFRFHPSDWVRWRRPTRFRTVPEVRRLAGFPVTCIYGVRDGVTQVSCPQLRGTGIGVFALPGGHHFDGAYSRVARLVLRTLRHLPVAPRDPAPAR